MKLADRLEHLGTETAFAVSAEAAAASAAGQHIYPFHIGDLNVKTPRNIVDASLRAIDDGKTGYCSNYGIAPLREALANEINQTRGTNYSVDNVVIEPGGKPTIGKLILAVVNPGEHVLYPNPGFPIYESQIEFHGGVAVPYTYREGKQNFELMLDDLEAAITPKTRLLIYNDLENPTGAESSPQEMAAIAELACKHDLIVLSDEAYFDLRYKGKSQSIAALPGMAERTVILYTFSKKYAMTGWRLGGAIGPKQIIDIFATLNVNDESCSNHFIQYGAIEALEGDQSACTAMLKMLQARRDAAVDILETIPGVRCYRPHATFYLFPNVTELIRRKGLDGLEALRSEAMAATGVSFCTREHFGRKQPGESESYIRLAYSGIDVDQIQEGLGKFKEWALG
jgi:aspartate/methionine/tyrosine aminotransferase